jgi:N,N-dimethylformamidase
MHIDSSRLDLCREFFARPAGPHSSELQHLLLLMRADTVEDPHMLLKTGPEEWMLALVQKRRGTAIEVLPDFVYENSDEGMRAQFALRWRLLTGDTLSFAPPVPDAGARRLPLVNRRITGYAADWDVHPGESLELKINPVDDGPVEVDFFRLRCAIDSPPDCTIKLEPVPSAAAGSYAVTRKQTMVGSHIAVDAAPPAIGGALTVSALVSPARPDAGHPQTIIGTLDAATQSGWALFLNDAGESSFVIGDGEDVSCQSAGAPLQADRWYRITASIDVCGGKLCISQRALQTVGPEAALTVSEVNLATIPVAGERILIGAWADGPDAAAAHFNGKIEAPGLYACLTPPGADPDPEHTLALWNFAEGIGSERAIDLGPNGWHGRFVNHPTRAVKGAAWDGSEHCWRHGGAHYGAVRFHDDAMTDCQWNTDVTVPIGDDWKSGIYTARLRQGGVDGYTTFFVTPKVGEPTARLALLVPTATYVCYGNDGSAVSHARMLERTMNTFASLSRTQAYVHQNLGIGASTYDLHGDGRGVSMASRLRPVLEMAPGEAQWNFGADTLIIDWLEEMGIAYDIITDEQLHTHGEELLKPYACVMTGSHPEYTSQEMMRALGTYRDHGGRLIYLGGNGFYWRIAFSTLRPGLIEIRRAEDGARNWIAESGEYYLSLSGELSGLWRRNGMAPQELVGVGTSGFGFDSATYYERTDASLNGRASWIFEGVGRDERIGDFGSNHGGAAGTEVDRADAQLGTPPHTLVIATASTFSQGYTTTPEDVLHQTGSVTGDTSPLVRADMAFFEAANGGAVFSTGSIAWADALAHNGYDNNVSRITDNVVRRFLEPAAF